MSPAAPVRHEPMAIEHRVHRAHRRTRDVGPALAQPLAMAVEVRRLAQEVGRLHHFARDSDQGRRGDGHGALDTEPLRIGRWDPVPPWEWRKQHAVDLVQCVQRCVHQPSIDQ